jgi:DNA repair exonuclease SbcCD nuclease subunit
MLIKGKSTVSIAGDIHLNLRDKNNTDWERGRFLELFTILANDTSDIVILSGDIFDKAIATMYEIAVFYEGLQLLIDANKKVFVIDGNHEELDASTTTFDFLPQEHFTRIKTDCLEFDSMYLWLVGHPHIKSLESPNFPIAKDKRNVLVSHYRSDIGFASEEISNELISNMFTETILSDIHYKLVPADNIRYTSSPYGIHYTPEKIYGYCQIHINSKGFVINDVILDLPSKIKLSVHKDELSDTVDSLDDRHMYKIDIVGNSDTDTLEMLQDVSNITKFSFSENYDDEMIEDITDELLVGMHNSLQDVIMVALGDLELTKEEQEKARQVLQEEL